MGIIVWFKNRIMRKHLLEDFDNRLFFINKNNDYSKENKNKCVDIINQYNYYQGNKEKLLNICDKYNKNEFITDIKDNISKMEDR